MVTQHVQYRKAQEQNQQQYGRPPSTKTNASAHDAKVDLWQGAHGGYLHIPKGNRPGGNGRCEMEHP